MAIKYLLVALPLLLAGCDTDKKDHFLAAEIKETKVTLVYSPITQSSYTGLCAYFEINELIPGKGWQPIKENAESHECGMEWDSILKGIRQQIRYREQEMLAGRESNNAETRLNAIKDDYTGKLVL